ncbi:MAG: hypothetical protein WCQ20_06115 [Synechococcaceae cyanobacterium ELA739]
MLISGMGVFDAIRPGDAFALFFMVCSEIFGGSLISRSDALRSIRGAILWSLDARDLRGFRDRFGLLLMRSGWPGDVVLVVGHQR